MVLGRRQLWCSALVHSSCAACSCSREAPRQQQQPSWLPSGARRGLLRRSLRLLPRRVVCVVAVPMMPVPTPPNPQPAQPAPPTRAGVSTNNYALTEVEEAK